MSQRKPLGYGLFLSFHSLFCTQAANSLQTVSTLSAAQLPLPYYAPRAFTCGTRKWSFQNIHGREAETTLGELILVSDF